MGGAAEKVGGAVAIVSGKFKYATELVKAVGLDKSVVSNILSLRLPPSKKAHMIRCWDIPDGLSLKQLLHGVPDLWKEREEMWGLVLGGINPQESALGLRSQEWKGK